MIILNIWENESPVPNHQPVIVSKQFPRLICLSHVGLKITGDLRSTGLNHEFPHSNNNLRGPISQFWKHLSIISSYHSLCTSHHILIHKNTVLSCIHLNLSNFSHIYIYNWVYWISMNFPMVSLQHPQRPMKNCHFPMVPGLQLQARIQEKHVLEPRRARKARHGNKEVAIVEHICYL